MSASFLVLDKTQQVFYTVPPATNPVVKLGESGIRLQIQHSDASAESRLCEPCTYGDYYVSLSVDGSKTGDLFMQQVELVVSTTPGFSNCFGDACCSTLQLLKISKGELSWGVDNLCNAPLALKAAITRNSHMTGITIHMRWTGAGQPVLFEAQATTSETPWTLFGAGVTPLAQWTCASPVVPQTTLNTFLSFNLFATTSGGTLGPTFPIVNIMSVVTPQSYYANYCNMVTRSQVVPLSLAAGSLTPILANLAPCIPDNVDAKFEIWKCMYSVGDNQRGRVVYVFLTQEPVPEILCRIYDTVTDNAGKTVWVTETKDFPVPVFQAVAPLPTPSPAPGPGPIPRPDNSRCCKSPCDISIKSSGGEAPRQYCDSYKLPLIRASTAGCSGWQHYNNMVRAICGYGDLEQCQYTEQYCNNPSHCVCKGIVCGEQNGCAQTCEKCDGDDACTCPKGSQCVNGRCKVCEGGVCCPIGYYGPKCDKTRANTCNNHGTPTFSGRCTCDPGWFSVTGGSQCASAGNARCYFQKQTGYFNTCDPCNCSGQGCSGRVYATHDLCCKDYDQGCDA